MSAEKLRQAAALMRERAAAATSGAWVCRQEHGRDYTDEGWSHIAVSAPVLDGGAVQDVALTATLGWDAPDEAVENSLHIASWHPAVALAVADLLDIVEAGYEDYLPDVKAETQMQIVSAWADNLATAYLGADR